MSLVLATLRTGLEAPGSAPTTPPRPLLPRIGAGDEAAVREFVVRYGGLVRALARRLGADDRDLEDACQDIFLALWRSAASYDPSRSDEATFVVVVAKRRLVDRKRSPGTRAFALDDDADGTAAIGGPSTTGALDRYVDARVAARTLAECSEPQRRVVEAVIGRGLTFEETSREAALPIGTVKSHYTRAIERVRRALCENERS